MSIVSTFWHWIYFWHALLCINVAKQRRRIVEGGGGGGVIKIQIFRDIIYELSLNTIFFLFFRVEAENGDLRKSYNAAQREKDSVAIELRDQIAQISLDRDTYKRQYTGKGTSINDVTQRGVRGKAFCENRS